MVPSELAPKSAFELNGSDSNDGLEPIAIEKDRS
jgi:hypothetical protein